MSPRSKVDEVLKETKAELGQALADGTWQPKAGDVLSQCEFIQVGFRSWGLEATDKSWKIVLSRLDFGDSNPSALLSVYSPNHQEAFEDLDWLAFRNSIGTNGGTNFNQCVARLETTLKGSKLDWSRRLSYLIERARNANAGANNGTFSSWDVPELDAPADYAFEGRLRRGRTISLFGPGSAGKTTIADALIASACSGVEILPEWRPVRPMATLILDWDEGKEEEKIRLAAICRAYGVKLGAGYHYKRQARPLHDVADEIGAFIVTNKVELLIVSPMGRAQRNFGENITAPVDEVHEILRSFGTTNIIIDHVTGANTKGGADREFGSVRKRDNVRGSWVVDVQSEEPGKRVLVMRNTKPDALMPRQPDTAVRIEFDPPWANPDHTYDGIRFFPDEIRDPDLPPPRVETQPARLIRALTEHGALTPVQLCAVTGFHANRVRDIVREARAKGHEIDFEDGQYVIRARTED